MHTLKKQKRNNRKMFEKELKLKLSKVIKKEMIKNIKFDGLCINKDNLTNLSPSCHHCSRLLRSIVFVNSRLNLSNYNNLPARASVFLPLLKIVFFIHLGKVLHHDRQLLIFSCFAKSSFLYLISVSIFFTRIHFIFFSTYFLVCILFDNSTSPFSTTYGVTDTQSTSYPSKYKYQISCSFLNNRC